MGCFLEGLTRGFGVLLQGQNRTTLDDELDRNLPFQLPLASGPAELPSYVTDHGFGFTVEDIPITGWPNLQQPWSGENIGELDFPLVAEGPGMQNSQLHYSGDGKIYRSPQLHAFSKTLYQSHSSSGILSISMCLKCLTGSCYFLEGDFPRVLEEDISIPGLSNPQLPNSVPWGQNRTTLDDELHQNPPFPDGTIGNFWTTNQLPLASGPAELPSYATDHGFGFTVENIPITGWPNLQQPWSGDVPWAVLETQETRIVSSDLEGGWIADTLLSKGLSVTTVRKVVRFWPTKGAFGFVAYKYHLRRLERRQPKLTNPQSILGRLQFGSEWMQGWALEMRWVRLAISWAASSFCFCVELVSSTCPLVVHQRCLSSAPSFDDSGKFYCPFCAYSHAILKYFEVKKKASLARKDLAAFIGLENGHRANKLCKRFLRSEQNQLRRDDNVNGNNQTNYNGNHVDEVNSSQYRENVEAKQQAEPSVSGFNGNLSCREGGVTVNDGTLTETQQIDERSGSKLHEDNPSCRDSEIVDVTKILAGDRKQQEVLQQPITDSTQKAACPPNADAEESSEEEND
ncbi:unnamed protein product [Camellia sinensis]